MTDGPEPDTVEANERGRITHLDTLCLLVSFALLTGLLESLRFLLLKSMGVQPGQYVCTTAKSGAPSASMSPVAIAAAG